MKSTEPDLSDATQSFGIPAGNVRELESLIDRALILSPEPVLRIDEYRLVAQGSFSDASPPSQPKELERRHISPAPYPDRVAHRRAGWSRGAFGTPVQHAAHRMKQFEMKRPPANCSTSASGHTLSPYIYTSPRGPSRAPLTTDRGL